MRARILLAGEVLLVGAVVLVTRCANYHDVFLGGNIYFVDADCYARMTRARICFEHPASVVRHHDFENYPIGTTPHTAAPLDYLIAGLAALLRPWRRDALDLAGALISPILAVAVAIFLCAWSRLAQLRCRFALLALYAVSPILAHATALGRPDHQSLLLALIAVALCAEWLRENPSARGWSAVAGASWALALWVSLYEPLVLLVLVCMTRVLLCIVRGESNVRALNWRVWCTAFVLILVFAFAVERRLPELPRAWPALRNWAGGIGELAHVPLWSAIWFQWCSWVILLTPLLFLRKERRGGMRPIMLVLSGATFLLTMWQARWSYFFAFIFALLAPEILSFFHRRLIAAAIFLIALLPVAGAWDRWLAESNSMARAENRMEAYELRALASQISGPFLAPWWMSPALSYWSAEPGAAGSSHEALSGIFDTARFYSATDAGEAAAICARREVQWVVAYDGERVAETCQQTLQRPVAPDAVCYILDRRPSAAPAFLQLRAQTARFKLYQVRRF